MGGLPVPPCAAGALIHLAALPLDRLALACPSAAGSVNGAGGASRLGSRRFRGSFLRGGPVRGTWPRRLSLATDVSDMVMNHA